MIFGVRQKNSKPSPPLQLVAFFRTANAVKQTMQSYLVQQKPTALAEACDARAGTLASDCPAVPVRSATHPQHKWSTPCQVVPRAINESVQAPGGLRDMSQHVQLPFHCPSSKRTVPKRSRSAHALNDGMIRCPFPGSPFS